ncbi:hypothetical protein GCM10022247_47340 [Allokutzneria multivorans]|uniref:DUF2269 family protein n=1 Tax=Allokutzneria multivorans TaxID=1142134 RepID=A0ABP7SZ57_9PSEU
MSRQFKPRARKLALLVHVLFGVAWIGFEVMVLILAITGVTTENPRVLHAAYVVLGEFGPALYAPFSFGTLVSGIVLSVGTHWGLVKHYWVVAKLAISVATLLGGNLVIAGLMRDAGERVLGADIDTLDASAVGSIQNSLLMNAIVVITLLVFATVLSYYKPWGKLRRAQAAPSGAAARRGNRPPRPQQRQTTLVGGTRPGTP